jgi:hypothetical protein
MLEVLNRSGGAGGFFGSTVKRGALSLFGAAPARTDAHGDVNRQRLRAADGAAYRLAHERLLNSVADRVKAYEPGIRQKDLDAANWKSPVAVHLVLKPEVERIRQYAWDTLRDLGYPIDTEFEDLRVEMEKSAQHIVWHLHQKTFVGLCLPGFFQMSSGILDYEMTFETRDPFGGFAGQYHPVGARTAHRYDETFYGGRKPSLHIGD